jgi:ubiquinone/menaquinone biosynthesis C-methylase UbiE
VYKVDDIIQYYNQFDEWGRLNREPIEFLVNTHFIRKHLPPNGHVLDNGAGPGKYAVHLAESGYEITLTDLTPRLVEQAKGRAQELQLEHRFRGFHAADARNLETLGDQQFDGALMLGPLYHLQEEQDRVRAVQELYRVTKPGAPVFVAFMSRIGKLKTSLQYPLHWKPNHTADGLAAFRETGKFDHSDAGRFTGAYFCNIEEIVGFMERNGFEDSQLISSSSIAGGMKPEQWEYWRSRGDEEFQQIMGLIMESAANPYILGTSSHILYIGKRKG